jgi:hypothetical protein
MESTPECGGRAGYDVAGQSQQSEEKSIATRGEGITMPARCFHGSCVLK